MPAHTHNYDKTVVATDSSLQLLGSSTRVTGFTATASTSAGSGSAHNNMAPFTAIHYIIRT